MSTAPEVIVKSTKPEKLILAVKTRPCLWNSGCSDYRIKSMKADAWDEVAMEVIDEWKAFTRAEKHVALRFLVRRWNNIRDYFNKSIKANYLLKLQGKRSGSRGRKKYAFADALEFIRPELEKNLNGFVNDLESVEAIKPETEEHDEEEIDIIEEEEEPNITFVDTIDHSYEEPETRRFRYNEKEEDADLMFLKSLLPDMKKLADDEKFAFKYAIMDAYMGIIRKRKSSE